MKDLRAELKADLQASEARWNQKIDEVKEELRETKDEIKALLLAQTPRRHNLKVNTALPLTMGVTMATHPGEPVSCCCRAAGVSCS